MEKFSEAYAKANGKFVSWGVGMLLLAVTLLPGCSGSGPKSVSSEEYGEDWPLEVDGGTLHCEADAVTFTGPDGSTYAVNGVAMSRDLGRNIQDIQAPNPGGPGTLKDTGPLIEDGLALCS